MSRGRSCWIIVDPLDTSEREVAYPLEISPRPQGDTFPRRRLSHLSAGNAEPATFLRKRPRDRRCAAGRMKPLSPQGRYGIGVCSMRGIRDRATLAHERLAIVDVDHGAQPLRSVDGELPLAVNGGRSADRITGWPRGSMSPVARWRSTGAMKSGPQPSSAGKRPASARFRGSHLNRSW